MYYKLLLKLCYHLQRGAQLNISVVDRDPDSDDFDDLIDHFAIPINISAGSSVTRNFTGRYKYVQLELSIEVRCTTNNTDESCVCLPGFTGVLCENNIDDCIGVTCNNRGRCVDRVQNFSCNCEPGYTGTVCETGKYLSLVLKVRYLGWLCLGSHKWA